ncbi:MAG: RNA methyltransferase, partial [Crocinitomicaceae bacterium]|tara:strand:+ start:247 stop:432 length:186 start_codon:yes stop_codon:yes gene_type:complete
MAYGEYLEERINNVLSERQIQFDARKMMGGLCYMIDDKMYFGIIKSDLMARVLVDAYEELI